MKFIALTFLLGSFSFSLRASISDIIELGERLFLDQRFSEKFVRDTELQGGFSINVTEEHLSCASCHQIDQSWPSKGMRSYTDFTRLTAIPVREDSVINLINEPKTLRNTTSLLGIGSQYNQNRISHYDGEFFDHSETVLGNFSGRNMGWLKTEKEKALKNIVRVIRLDNPEQEDSYTISFAKIFGLNPQELESSLIVEKVVEAVTAYMNDLDFERDEEGFYSGSPYDQFLKLNEIDRGPKENETIFTYRNRIRLELSYLFEPKFVEKKVFETHKTEFGFGAEEFRGLQIFFNIQGDNTGDSRGMCIACHTPPLFSDQFFHNIGTTQLEYDSIHGEGSFAKFEIPSLENRGDQFFMDRPSPLESKKVDLGAWNFYGRNEKLTSYLKSFFCRNKGNPCDDSKILNAMVGRLKTPSLRNLGHSNPYFHNGSQDSLMKATSVYQVLADLKQSKKLRNGAPQLNGINLSDKDIKSLVAFLKSLNEEYQ